MGFIKAFRNSGFTWHMWRLGGRGALYHGGFLIGHEQINRSFIWEAFGYDSIMYVPNPPFSFSLVWGGRLIGVATAS